VNFFWAIYAVLAAAVFGFLGVFQAIWPIWALWSVVFVVWALSGATVVSAPTLQWFETLIHRASVPYTATLDRVMAVLDRLLQPQIVTEHPKPTTGIAARFERWTTPRARDQSDRDALRENPWSRPVLNAALRVAIIYPFYLALLGFALGSTATIGAFALIPNATPRWLAGASIGGLFVILVTSTLAVATSNGTLKKVSIWLILPTAIALLFSGAVGVAAAVFFSFENAVNVVIVGSMLLSVSSSILSVAIPFLREGAGGFDFYVTIASILVAAVVVASTAMALAKMTLLKLAKAKSRGLLVDLVFLFVCFCLAFGASALVTATNRSSVWSVGLVLLPLVNALFDWLSYGATIWLMRKGRRKGGGWPFLAGFADIGVALVLLAAVSVALVTVLGFLDMARGDQFIDVGVLLTGLRDAPGQNWWVVAMVASTLVPTLVHLALAFVSSVTWVPVRVWDGVLKRLNLDHAAPVTFAATLVFTALIFFYVLAPVGLIWGTGYALWVFGGALRDVYVAGLIDYASWVGFL